jgi:O-antigen/teichoic acid export membrane protein
MKSWLLSSAAISHFSRELVMRVSLQGLANEVIGYSIGAIANRILGIVVACIYPILLSQDEYGRLDVVFSIETLLLVILFLGFDAALSRFYYEQTDVIQRRQLVSTVFYSVMSFTLLSVGILLAVSQPLALWLYKDPRYILYFRLALISMPFMLANGVPLVVLRLERRIRTYNFLMAGNLATASLVGIASILAFRIGAAGVLIGFLTGHVVTCSIGIYLCRRSLFSVPLPGRIRELLRIGIPLVPSGVALWLIGFANRPMLVHSVSAKDLGLYAIASGAVGMMGMLLGAFRNAWHPFAFSIIGHEGSENIYGRALTLFTIGGAFIATCGSLFAPQLLLILNAFTHKNWSGAAPCIGPLAIGALFGAMYFVVQTGAYIVRRTSIIATTMGIAALANILFNFLLIPRYGILGAAVAILLVHFIALVSLYIAAQRIAKIPYQPIKLFMIVLIATAVIFLAPILETNIFLKDLILKTALLAFYCIALFASRVLTTRDLSLLWNMNWRTLLQKDSPK